MVAVRFIASNARTFAILASALAFATWSGVEPTVLRSSRSGGPALADSWAFRSCRSRILAPSSADRWAQLDACSRTGSLPSTYWLSHNRAHSTKGHWSLRGIVGSRIGYHRRTRGTAGTAERPARRRGGDAARAASAWERHGREPGRHRPGA